MFFLATEDADVPVLCHLGNEAAMSDDIPRYRVACSSDQQLQHEPVQSITEIYSYFSVMGNSFNFNSHSQDTEEGGCCLLVFSFPHMFACCFFFISD